MKRFLLLATAAMVCFSFLNVSADTGAKRKIDWKHVSKNLEMALTSHNEGLRNSAMVLYIRHADQLNVHGAVYDVMRVYRNHKDERVRKLALVTLQKMRHPWAMEFLKVDYRYQDSPKLKRMVAAILQEYEESLKRQKGDDKAQVSE